MIPKIIHYIWIGDKPIPDIVLKNMQYLDGYEVKVWTDKDFTFTECPFAFESKLYNKPQYASDALRCYVLKQYGGIYLDCDVELKRLIPEELLELPYFCGNTGDCNGQCDYITSIVGTEKESKIIEALWDNLYSKIHLVQNGKLLSINDTDRFRNYIIETNLNVKSKINSIEEYKQSIDKYDLCFFNNDGFDNYNENKDFSFANHNHNYSWKEFDKGYMNTESVPRIPKVIHYCWISGEENMPDDIKKCIESWHKYLPDYTFINWNDSNFDWDVCEFTKIARENNRYAFCADFVRFWAVYTYGGIYLDSDVSVFKSFNDLLEREYFFTKENLYQSNNFIEAAIFGAEAGNEFLGNIVNYYINENPPSSHDCIVAPDIMRRVHDQNGYDLELMNCVKYFNANSEHAYAQHNFKNSWCCGKIQDCTYTDNFKMFLCAHKPIENYIPKNDKYIILALNKSVVDDDHLVIYLDEDEFCKKWNVAYSEGSAMHYLWKHPDLIPEYMGFGHYRRMFVDFAHFESFLAREIQFKNAVITHPLDHHTIKHNTNKDGIFHHHPHDDAQAFIDSVYEAAPEYKESFDELLNDHYQYGYNVFCMKKENFLEMCEMCFKVLDHFNKKQGYTCNEDVLFKMMEQEQREGLFEDTLWQCRLQGFWLEWLTELYYRHKFGVDNCFKSKIGIPNKI